MEKLIDFDTATLAHSLGFDWIDKKNTSYSSIYNINDEISTVGVKLLTSWMKSWKEDPTDSRYNYLCLRPTQAYLQKWLREEHNIHLIPDLPWIKNGWEVKGYSLIDGSELFTIRKHSSYEEALEVGLKEAITIATKIKG